MYTEAELIQLKDYGIKCLLFSINVKQWARDPCQPPICITSVLGKYDNRQYFILSFINVYLFLN